MHEQYLLTLSRWLSLFFKGKKASAKKVEKFNKSFRIKHRGPKFHGNRNVHRLLMKYDAFGAKPSEVKEDLAWVIAPNEVRDLSRVMLEDSYVRQIIQSQSGISAKNITDDAVEAKRAHIKVRRLIKELSK